MLKDNETKQHTPRDPKNTLLGVELNAVCSEFCEGLLSLFGLDHDVIHVGLNGLPDKILETLKHATLVRSPHVLLAERYCDVAERSKWGDERCCMLVKLFHRDLMHPEYASRKQWVSHPEVESTTWSMRGKGNESFGHVLLRPM